MRSSQYRFNTNENTVYLAEVMYTASELRELMMLCESVLGKDYDLYLKDKSRDVCAKKIIHLGNVPVCISLLPRERSITLYVPSIDKDNCGAPRCFYADYFPADVSTPRAMENFALRMLLEHLNALGED